MVRKSEDPFVHLVAGGLGGSLGVLVTSPLEVVKTRLQSSICTYKANQLSAPPASRRVGSLSLVTLCRDIVKREGVRSMYKGLTPSLLTVLPSKALFFAAYNQSQHFLNKRLRTQGPIVNMASGTAASVMNVVLLNPLFVLKTKLQLDERSCSKHKLIQCTKEIWKREGAYGFFRGNSASIAGCLEPGMYFVLYEELKKHNPVGNLFSVNMQLNSIIPAACQYSFAACSSKLISNTLIYPTEVVRTRLRQDDLDRMGKRKYRKFWQTLRTVWAEEGSAGLYGGLSVQLIKTIPFTIITFLAYESIVYKWTEHQIQSDALVKY